MNMFLSRMFLASSVPSCTWPKGFRLNFNYAIKRQKIRYQHKMAAKWIG
jgi:hypothetical protein